jgi:ethanolamine ammonia-lyase small subunit
MTEPRDLTRRIGAEVNPPDNVSSELIAVVRARTPARILVGRAGPSYRTATQLELRRDHAAALDAVHAEVEMERDLGTELVRGFQLFEVRTRADSKEQYLVRPDLGRRLDDAARETLRRECPAGCVVQVAIGDGLSAAAIAAQVPCLLPLLAEQARERGWSFGRPFFIRHCRVGVLNDIGDILDPEVVVLLIGERPGLATAESLSAYLAFRPRAGHTDAQRNLISNIHARGVGPEEAARRIMALAEQMRRRQMSGIAVKEEFPSLLPSPPHPLPLAPEYGGEGSETPREGDA